MQNIEILIDISLVNILNYINLTKERLDWFNFETKSRQTTQKLIQPILDQLAEDKKQFLNIYNEMNDHGDRLKLLEYAVFESGNKQTVIDKLYDKISNIEQERKKDQAKLAHFMKNLESSLNETLEIFNVMKENVDKVKKQSDSLAENQDKVNESIFNIKGHVNNKNDELQQRVEDRFNLFQNKITDLHNLITYQGTQIDQASNENFKTQIASLKLNQGKILRDIELLYQDKADKSAVQENTDNINQIIAEHTKNLEDNKNHSITIENFMEKYLPIKIQSQISDTVKIVTDKKSRKNLDLYEQHKYEELHSAILEDNGDPSIVHNFKRMATFDPKSGFNKHLNTSKTLPNQAKFGFQTFKTNDFEHENSIKSKKTLSSKQTLSIGRGYEELGEIPEILTSNIDSSQIEEKEHESHSEATKNDDKYDKDEPKITLEYSKQASKIERTTTEFSESKENEEEEDESDENHEKIRLEKVINLIDVEVRKRIDVERSNILKIISDISQQNLETESKTKETHEYVINLHSIVDEFQSKVEQLINQFQQKYSKDFKQIKNETQTFQIKQENILNKLKNVDSSETKEEIHSNVTINPNKTFYLSADSRNKPNTAIHLRNLSALKANHKIDKFCLQEGQRFLSNIKSKVKNNIINKYPLNDAQFSKHKDVNLNKTISNFKSIYSPQPSNDNLDSYLSVKALRSFDNRDENYLPVFDKKLSPMTFISRIK